MQNYDKTWQTITKVVDALKLMSKLNNVIQDTHGNVSQRCDDFFYIKPSGMPYKDITWQDICKISVDGELDIGSCNNRLPSVDSIHHANIYRNNPHIKSICHTHSPYAVAFATVGRDITCYTTEQSDYFGNDIFCQPYSDLNNWGSDLVLIPGEKAVLLAHHGVLTFGINAIDTVRLAAALENIAMKNYLIETLSCDVPTLPDEEIDKWHERYNNIYGQRDNSNSK